MVNDIAMPMASMKIRTEIGRLVLNLRIQRPRVVSGVPAGRVTPTGSDGDDFRVFAMMKFLYRLGKYNGTSAFEQSIEPRCDPETATFVSGFFGSLENPVEIRIFCDSRRLQAGEKQCQSGMDDKCGGAFFFNLALETEKGRERRRPRPFSFCDEKRGEIWRLRPA
jgi:hypothetical protein